VGLEIRIEGAATFHRVAAQMRAEGQKDLSRRMADALDDAVEPVKVSIRREAETAMPSSGGYSALLSKSLRWKLARRVGAQRAFLKLNTYADGTSERRDVQALERGNLRHPIYGRSRKIKRGRRAGTIQPNPWAVTSVRAGFHERGTAQAIDLAQDALVEVVEEYAARLIK
jgi:hypothetical protein